jgi:hypothetical protein
MLVVVDLAGMQGHPQPYPLQVRMRAVVSPQRTTYRARQRFYEQALGHLRANQDEHAVTAVLVIAISPRDSRLAEGLPHRTVQAVPDGYLVEVGPTPIPEPLNVDGKDSPMNGRACILHTSSREDKAEATLSLT